ncbi:hypothetical protein DFP72DRAFT_1057953 [Ephemerocybe angulata]|uniref:DUF6699 domain-containing protein n=1 Tax=Ephemerocybe angulata TaxID=980116 RepID=A0A8H6IJ22_9AGAR|nr:hypothetical protein DFP72DRAFT_1057953 [Tulosesus angulatus]
MSSYLRKIFSLASPPSHASPLGQGNDRGGKGRTKRSPISKWQQLSSPLGYTSPVKPSAACLSTATSELSTLDVDENVCYGVPKTPKIPCRELEDEELEWVASKLEDCTHDDVGHEKLPSPDFNPGKAWIAPPNSWNASTSSFSSNDSWSTWGSSTTVNVQSSQVSLGAVTPSGRPAKSKRRVSFANPCKRQPKYMHPLFAWTRSRPNAPIAYEVSLPPTSTVRDDYDGSMTIVPTVTDFFKNRVPINTLMEPATEPPTRGSMTLCCEGFDWDVVVRASSGRPGLGRPSGARGSRREKGRKFYIDSSDSDDELEDEDDDEDGERTANDEPVITNLDVLSCVHSALAKPITQAEWAALGDGDTPQQRRISRAYRSRCQETELAGGGVVWAQGVRRVDLLQGKSTLVGIEAKDSSNARMASVDDGGDVVGRLVFSEGQ